MTVWHFFFFCCCFVLFVDFHFTLKSKHLQSPPTEYICIINEWVSNMVLKSESEVQKKKIAKKLNRQNKAFELLKTSLQIIFFNSIRSHSKYFKWKKKLKKIWFNLFAPFFSHWFQQIELFWLRDRSKKHTKQLKFLLWL